MEGGREGVAGRERKYNRNQESKLRNNLATEQPTIYRCCISACLSKYNLEFSFTFLHLAGFPKPTKGTITRGYLLHWNPEHSAQRPLASCHLLSHLHFHPPRGKEEQTLTPWERCPRCLRRSLVWSGWHAGHSQMCHTSSPGNKRRLWGSANSRQSGHPATWWSKHGVIIHKRGGTVITQKLSD